MVGRLRDRVLHLRGFETSIDWPTMVLNANHPNLILNNASPCEACSDFACFRNQNVPYIYFYTGLHEEYHSPADDVELVNFPGLVEIGELSLRVLTRLAIRIQQ
jgi:aminopeptidase YwaD